MRNSATIIQFKQTTSAGGGRLPERESPPATREAAGSCLAPDGSGCEPPSGAGSETHPYFQTSGIQPGAGLRPLVKRGRAAARAALGWMWAAFWRTLATHRACIAASAITTAAMLLMLYAAVAWLPRCTPGSQGVRVGNVLMGGCQ